MKKVILVWTLVLFGVRWYGMWLTTHYLHAHSPKPFGLNKETFLFDWNCDQAPWPWYDVGVLQFPVALLASYALVLFIYKLSND